LSLSSRASKCGRNDGFFIEVSRFRPHHEGYCAGCVVAAKSHEDPLGSIWAACWPVAGRPLSALSGGPVSNRLLLTRLCRCSAPSRRSAWET